MLPERHDMIDAGLAKGAKLPHRIAKKLYYRSVFFPLNVRKIPTKDLAIALYHRTSVVVYLACFSWGLATVLSIWQNSAVLPNSLLRIIIGGLVMFTAGPAALGAMFFPRSARLELFSAASFLSLLILYIGFLAFFYIQSGQAWGSIFLIIGFAAKPIGRILFIFFTLIKNAETKADDA